MPQDLMNKFDIGAPIDKEGYVLVPLFSKQSGRFIPSLRQALQSGAVRVFDSDKGMERYQQECEKNVPYRLQMRAGGVKYTGFRAAFIENQSDTPILLRASDILLGGRQDRVLDRHCVIPPRSLTDIPVSCAESGRWKYNGSPLFQSSSQQLPLHIREQRLSKRLQNSEIQHQTWNMIRKEVRRQSILSPTKSIQDVLTKSKEEHVLFPYVNRASGLVLFKKHRRDFQFHLLEWFCNTQLCKESWDSTLKAAIRPTKKRYSVSLDPFRLRRGIQKILQTLTPRRAEDAFLGQFSQMTLGGYKGTAVADSRDTIYFSLLNPLRSTPRRRRE
ncbi:MAG: DUF6569 family protein [Myxococcota bacterium]|nr:DUF6569 family protein [Myxococcota bacterium]